MRARPAATLTDSAYEWLGAVPIGWGEKPLFAVMRERRRKNVAIGETNVLSLSYGRIVPRDVSTNEGLLPESFDTYNVVEPGDIVLRLTDLQNDQRSLRVGFVRQRGIVTSAYVTVVPGGEVLPAFGYYLLHAYDLTKVFYTLGGGVRQSMKFEDLKRIPVLLPSLGEQRAIADFLDRKTAAIDALIAKKERLIELLEEKRQALITQAVTKGLDPNVPMKDSGIDWLGPIPAHWKQCALRYAAMFQRGHDLPAEARSEGSVPIVSSAGVIGTHSVAAARGPGIVTGRYGSIGKFHLIEGDYWPLNTALYTRSLCGNDPRFLWYALTFLEPFFVLESKKSAVPGVDRNDLHQYPVALPPLSEQRAIARMLDEERERVEAIVARTKSSVEKMREYRQALITAAVTGKIDVTQEQA